MLNFAYEYKQAVNEITDIRDMKLRAYEIEAHEWNLVRQLRDLLKVRFLFHTLGSWLNLHFLDFQGRHVVLLAWWHT